MVSYVDPTTGTALRRDGEAWRGDGGASHPIVRGVARFCSPDNYTSSFGRQWNRFAATQIDDERQSLSLSADRLFIETGWPRGGLAGETVLEVGSGAGRFTRTLLTETQADVHSVDFSEAVEANLANNGAIADGRLHLAQASVYELPFAPGTFDKVLCLGVIQHTPDVAKTVAALVAMAKPGGEIVIDFYEVRGWYTKIHAKYLLRPITRHLSHARLERLIERHVDRLMATSRWLHRHRLGVLARFLPLVDMTGIESLGLSPAATREWAVLDTFDQYSPRYDQPQRTADVARMAEAAGAEVTFAGQVQLPNGLAAVVRARRR